MDVCNKLYLAGIDKELEGKTCRDIQKIGCQYCDKIICAVNLYNATNEVLKNIKNSL